LGSFVIQITAFKERRDFGHAVYFCRNMIVNILRMFPMGIDFDRNYEYNIIELL